MLPLHGSEFGSRWLRGFCFDCLRFCVTWVSGITGVAGGDIPTIELTAADVGDIDDDEDWPFVAAAEVRALVTLSVATDTAADGCVFAEFSAEFKDDFEALSVVERRVLLTLSPSGGRVFAEFSASCDECFLELTRGAGESGNGGGGGCACVAGTHLSASFIGDDAAEDDAVDFVGDGVPTWPGCDAGPVSTCNRVSDILFSESSASRPRPSTQVGFVDVFMCFEPAVLSFRLRLPDHRSNGST